MYDLQARSRRLLQETAATLASSPISSDNSQTDYNALDVNGSFNPSMAIIFVVLLSAFFFMAFFSIYVRRCSSGPPDAPSRTGPRQPTGSQGVDAAFLETLPLIAYSSAKKKGSNVECVVCLADFEEGEPLCQLPRCKHVFHKDCIDMWLFSHTTCPLCRRSVTSDNTQSFRWGGGSGSLRLSVGARESRRRNGQASEGGPSPSTPISGQGQLPDMTERTNFGRVQGGRFPRSHSTGHSMAKQSQAIPLSSGIEEHEDYVDERARGGCLPLTPPSALQRSRSVAAAGDGRSAQIKIGGWVRDAGASLKMVLSVKRASSVGTFGAVSSSTAAFNRISPV